MKFEKLQPGMTLYDVGSHRMGNTTIRTISVWTVRVIDVHPNRTITASWNGNLAKLMYEHEWSKLRAKKPELERSAVGAYRIKRRAPR